MALDFERLLAHRFPELRQRYSERDAIIYALGLGLGADPQDERDLDYLLETRAKVLPTMAVTLASPGMWIRDPAFGVTFAKLVHSAQDAAFHAPLPPSAEVKAIPRVATLYDRGQDRGALLTVEREVRDAADNRLYATVRQTLLLRADGGFGGPPPPRTESAAPPERVPDIRHSVTVSPRAALIYRLSGDLNPLHADPGFARKAGFERPILHGLASYGIAGDVVMRSTGKALQSLACRFAGVVVPGDIIQFSLWVDGKDVSFEAKVAGRTVLDQGRAGLAEAQVG